MNSLGPSRGDYIGVGAVGLVVGLVLLLVHYWVSPALAPFAFLSVGVLGTPVFTMVFLLVLGLVALAEFPLMFYALIRLARQAAPAWLQLSTHAAYTFFPALYGAIGTLLTGEVWWLAVMALLAVLRLTSSSAGIQPRVLAAIQAKRRQAMTKAAETDAPAALPTIAPDALAPADFSLFQRPSEKEARPLESIEGYVLDMDGVLYQGEQIRAGAASFVRYLQRHGIPFVCLSNNASRTRAGFAEKLQRIGLPITGEHVIGAAQATAEWLAQHAPKGARVLPVGEPGLSEELARQGFALVDRAPADYVVVGIDFHMTYQKLKEAALALRQKAIFIGTNPDLTFPSEEGLVPGNGAQLAYLEAATGVAPTLVGKPQPAMMEVALAHLGLPADRVAMVGDRLDTDILGGKNVGMTTILLMGGVTGATELATSALRPDYVFDDLAALQDALEK